MGTEKINRLKIVLVEQAKTGKWLAGQLGKNEYSSRSLRICGKRKSAVEWIMEHYTVTTDRKSDITNAPND